MKKLIAIALMLAATIASAQTFKVQTLNVLDTTNPTTPSTGGATFAGGIGVAQDVNIGGSFRGAGVFTNITASGTVGGAGFTNLLAPYDFLPVAGTKTQYVASNGNDGNAGTSWGTAKKTLQAAINAATPGGKVYVSAETYTLSSTLFMQANVTLQCSRGTVIQQAASTALNLLIDFSVNVANGASIRDCIIDGNRSNNADNFNNILAYVSTANDVVLTNNTFRNGTGSAVEVTSGLRPIVAYNKFNNFFVGPVFFITPAGQTVTSGQVVGNTVTGNIGQHAITFNNSDGNIVQGNVIIAQLQTGMTVTQSGTTVTWVSGPTFSSLSPGSFLILNGGVEELITSITSSTSMQVNTSNSFGSVPAAAGPGDLLSVASASNNILANNYITGGVGGGIVISNFIAGSSVQKNQVIGNVVKGQGEGCIELESENAFGTQVFDTQIRGNSIANCGVGTTAVAANTRYGIALIDFNPNTLLNTYVEGNYVVDDQGSPTTLNWLETTGLAVGQVFVQNNASRGMINPGVAGGIASVSLSAGWGSTASANATSYGDGFVVNVTSNGTGQSAGATVSVNTVATSGTPPVMACQFLNGTGTVNFAFGQSPGVNAVPSVTLFAFNGTPVAGNTYNFLCKG